MAPEGRVPDVSPERSSPLCQVVENIEWAEGHVHLLGEAVGRWRDAAAQDDPRGFSHFLWVTEVCFLSQLESRAGGTQKWD